MYTVHIRIIQRTSVLYTVYDTLSYILYIRNRTRVHFNLLINQFRAEYKATVNVLCRYNVTSIGNIVHTTPTYTHNSRNYRLLLL